MGTVGTPDTDFAGYLASLKTGYLIFGILLLIISKQFSFFSFSFNITWIFGALLVNLGDPPLEKFAHCSCSLQK